MSESLPAADVVAAPDAEASPLVLEAEGGEGALKEGAGGAQEEVPAQGAFAAAAAAAEEEGPAVVPGADGLVETAVDGGGSVAGVGGWGDICEDEA